MGGQNLRVTREKHLIWGQKWLSDLLHYTRGQNCLSNEELQWTKGQWVRWIRIINVSVLWTRGRIPLGIPTFLPVEGVSTNKQSTTMKVAQLKKNTADEMKIENYQGRFYPYSTLWQLLSSEFSSNTQVVSRSKCHSFTMNAGLHSS